MKEDYKFLICLLLFILLISVPTAYKHGKNIGYRDASAEKDYYRLNLETCEEEQEFCANKHNYSLMECKYEKITFDIYNYGKGMGYSK